MDSGGWTQTDPLWALATRPWGGDPRQRAEAATAARRGWSALVALPDFGSWVLSASAVVAYVAVGAAAILSRSVTEAARHALGWALSRDGKAQPSKE